MPFEGPRYADEEHRILNPERRDLEPEPGDQAFIHLSIPRRSIDRKRRTVDARFSDESTDRHGERILVEAWEKNGGLDDYRRNPVLIAQHTYAAPDGSPTVIGQVENLRVTPEALVGRAKFLDGDELAEKWWRRFEQRAMRAFSVGFMIEDYRMDTIRMRGGEKRRQRVITAASLAEISAVSVPSNKFALVRQASGSPPLMPMDAALAAEPPAGGGGVGGGGSNRRTQKTLQRSMRAMLREELVPMLRRELDPQIPGSPVELVIRETIAAMLPGLQAYEQTMNGRGQASGHRQSSPVEPDGPFDPADPYLAGLADLYGEAAGEADAPDNPDDLDAWLERGV